MKFSTHLLTPGFALTLLASSPDLSAQGTASLTTLYSFKGGTHGADPAAALVQGSDGNFYGTTAGGYKDSGSGTVFQITPGGVLTTLYTFNPLDSKGDNADGIDPGGLIQGSDGNFYGVTFKGGAGGNGTVFRITPAGVLTTLHAFAGSGTAGVYPRNLTQGQDGNFYGATDGNGSASGNGTVFQITPAGVFTTLHTFSALDNQGDNADGAFPSSLIQGGDGNFYGVAYYGGSSGNGTVFQITSAGVYTTLHSFTADGTEGANPTGNLVQGSDGNFYGVTGNGGSGDEGTVFQVTPAGVLTTLYGFAGDGSDGFFPNGGLVQGAGGIFYGTTNGLGTTSDGTVFQITPGGRFTTLLSFREAGNGGDDTGGSLPYAGLVQGNDGNLYGTTFAGGSSHDGTVFKLIPPPAITSAASATGTSGQLFSYQIKAAHNPTSYGARGLPGGLKVNTATGLISGSPTEVGTYAVGLSTTNASGTGTATLSLKVNGTLSPTITSPDTATATVGQTFSYQITASNSPKSYGERGLPSGLTLNATTGLISGKPTVAGTYNASLTATNAAGTGTTVVEITVSASTTLAFGASSYSVNEDAGSMIVHVLRNGSSAGAVSVTCATASGTAKTGTDYTGTSKTLSWAAGDTAQKAFTVSIKDVGITDGSTRQFSLKLSSPAGGAALGTPSTATVTIKENDPANGELEFASSSYSVNETAGTLTVYVDRTEGAIGAVSVTCATSSGTAKSGTDYTGTSKTLSWTDGDKSQKSFTVTIKNRGSSGGNGLQFSMVLSSPTGSAILGSPATATVTIN